MFRDIGEEHSPESKEFHKVNVHVSSNFMLLAVNLPAGKTGINAMNTLSLDACFFTGDLCRFHR